MTLCKKTVWAFQKFIRDAPLYLITHQIYFNHFLVMYYLIISKCCNIISLEHYENLLSKYNLPRFKKQCTRSPGWGDTTRFEPWVFTGAFWAEKNALFRGFYAGLRDIK